MVNDMVPVNIIAQSKSGETGWALIEHDGEREVIELDDGDDLASVLADRGYESDNEGAFPDDDAEYARGGLKPCRLLSVCIQGGLKDSFRSTQKPNWIAIVVLIPSGKKKVLSIEDSDVANFPALQKAIAAQGFSCERPDPSANVLDLPDSLIRSLTGGNYPSPGNSPNVQTMSPQDVNRFFLEHGSVDPLLYQVKPTQEGRASAGAALFSSEKPQTLEGRIKQTGDELVAFAKRVNALANASADFNDDPPPWAAFAPSREPEQISEARKRELLAMTPLGQAVLAS
jgi:hypothetical protein